MNTTWNLNEIAKMNGEQRVRNACRQIETEQVIWGRRRLSSYRNHAVSMGENWTGEKRVSVVLHKNKAVVHLDGRPVSLPVSVRLGCAAKLYLAIMDARDSIEALEGGSVA